MKPAVAAPPRSAARHRNVAPLQGFTLLELLIAVVVLLLICTLAAEMASGTLGTVSEASGRVTTTQKLERLRRLLTDDLRRLPHLDDTQPRLTAGGDTAMWRAELQLPARSTAQGASGAWERVIYRWEKRSASLWREVKAGDTTRMPDSPALSGLLDFEAEWLMHGANQPQGVKDWKAAAVPAALRVRVKLTDVWEEGDGSEDAARSGRVREFVLVIPVGAGR